MRDGRKIGASDRAPRRRFDPLTRPTPWRNRHVEHLPPRLIATEGFGFFRVASAFQDPPTTSNINRYDDDQTLANMEFVNTTSGIAVQGGGSGRAHLIIDVMGDIA